LFENELSAWDQLGEGYERDAANIGGSRDGGRNVRGHSCTTFQPTS
jgi:hypothetical protein